MKKFEKIISRVTTAKSKYEDAIENLESELKKISNVDDLIFDDSDEDGLCVGIQGYDNYISIDNLFEIIENNGTFTREDIIESIF